MFKKLVLAALLAVSPVYTMAHNAPDGPSIQYIITHESIEGETYHDFVMRIGRFMNGWTKSSHAEMCGILSEKEGQYFVILGTIGSQLSCTTNTIVVGSKPTGDTIHSHPALDPLGRIKITDQTRHIEGERVPPMSYMQVNTNIFSKGDYDSGPGFLIAEDMVKYQNGRGTMKVIGKLPPAGH